MDCSYKYLVTVLLFQAALFNWPSASADVSVNTFNAGNTISASAMNDNFAAMKAAIENLQATVTNLQSKVTSLESERASQQATINTLQNNSVLALNGYLRLETDSRGYATARFDAVNVQVTNGTPINVHGPSALNGLGNLIVGYNSDATSGTLLCNLGSDYTAQPACELAGGVWGFNFKTGSHNLVVGEKNSYSSHAGVVAGDGNRITGLGSVAFGNLNTASGLYSSVSGGYTGTASGANSSVSGGYLSAASGTASSISGGYLSAATGYYSSVFGGALNTASGNYSSVSGGYSNTADGFTSSISGGFGNTASGNYSSISGGTGGSVSGEYDWRGGSSYFSDF